MSNNKKTNAAVCSREGYEAATALRALDRAGQCPQLKGHVHEIMFCDKYNLTPTNLIEGNHAALTNSTTAQMRDVVMTKGGKIVGHAQLKDTVSNAGVRKTIEQIKGGKYAKTAVFGTEETSAKIAGKVTQKVHSSGISSETTTRIAAKALGQMPSSTALATVAKSGGVTGAMFGAGIEAVSSIGDVLNGKKKVSDAVIDVGGAAAKGAINGSAAAAAGTTAAGVTGAALTTLGMTGGAMVFAPAVVGFGVAAAVGSFISGLFD